MKNEIKIYCDGSARNNKKIEKRLFGSFSSIVYLNNERFFETTEGFENITNNQMELSGFVFPIFILKKQFKEIYDNSNIEVISDSQYLTKGVNEWLNGWIKKNWHTTSGKVKNLEIWKLITFILNDMKQKNNDYTFTWVKGHNGHDLNEACDNNCNEKVKKLDFGQEEPMDFESVFNKMINYFINEKNE